MGTRDFSSTEQSNSRIKWKLADPITTQKLCEATRKMNYGKVGKVIVYLPFVFLIAILCSFILVITSNFFQLQNKENRAEWIFMICFSMMAFLFFMVFFIVLIKSHKKTIPYLYPEKQKNIWIFCAKCTDVTPYYVSSHKEHYSAFFQKGGVFIAIPITGYECKNQLPVGKEYLFYKFNDRTGNRWAAIPKEKLEELPIV